MKRSPLLWILFFVASSTIAWGQGYAPNAIGGSTLECTILSGAGNFARAGSFTLAYKADNHSVLVRSSFGNVERNARYTYSKVGPNVGIIDEDFDGKNYAGPMRTTLQFDSPSGGIAIAVFKAGGLGEQRFRFRLRPGQATTKSLYSAEPPTRAVQSREVVAERSDRHSSAADLAPDSLEDKVLTAKIVSGSGRAAGSGSMTINFVSNGNYLVAKSSASNGLRPGTFTYFKRGPRGAMLVFTYYSENDSQKASSRFGGPEVATVGWTLDFDSPNHGTATMEERDFRTGISRQKLVFSLSDFKPEPPAGVEALPLRVIPKSKDEPKLPSDSPWVLKFARGEALYFSGRFADAVRAYEELIVEDSEEANDIFRQAKSLVAFRAYMASIKAGDKENVRKYEGEMSANPWTYRDTFHRALRAFMEGRKDYGLEMIAKARSLESIEPDFENYLTFLVQDGWVQEPALSERLSRLRTEIAAASTIAGRIDVLSNYYGYDRESEIRSASDSDPVYKGWCELAGLMSNEYLDGNGKPRKPASQRLYFPARYSQFKLKKADEIASGILSRFDALADSTDEKLGLAAEEARGIFRVRLQIASANDRFGNTPSSSLEDGYALLSKAMESGFLEEADKAEYKRALERENPNYNYIVNSAPMSDATRESWDSFLDSAFGLLGNAKEKGKVSLLLAHADMMASEKCAAWWKVRIGSIARLYAGQKVSEPLVEVKGQWRKLDQSAANRLDSFVVRNISGKALTSVFFILEAANEWGEKSLQGYYFPKLKPGESRVLLPQPRWENGRLDFTNTLTIKHEVLAAEGQFLTPSEILSNPVPEPDSATARRNFLQASAGLEKEASALGAAVSVMRLSASDPIRESRVLHQAVRSGRAYIIRGLTGSTPEARFMIRFSQAGEQVEVEIFDRKTKEPLNADKVKWKGKFDRDRELGEVVRMENGWVIAIGVFEHPKIVGSNDENAENAFKGRTFILYPEPLFNQSEAAK